MATKQTTMEMIRKLPNEEELEQGRNYAAAHSAPIVLKTPVEAPFLRVEYKPDGASHNAATAKITRASGTSFEGFVFRITPPLKKQHTPVVERLGATILPTGEVGLLETTVLLSLSVASEPAAPGEGMKQNPGFDQCTSDKEIGELFLKTIINNNEAQGQ